MIFQGQEILEWIPFGDDRIDWNKYDRFRGIYHLYRDLDPLRRNWFDNTRGLRGPHVQRLSRRPPTTRCWPSTAGIRAGPETTWSWC